MRTVYVAAGAALELPTSARVVFGSGTGGLKFTHGGGAVVTPSSSCSDGFISSDMASVNFPVEGAWAEVEERWSPGGGDHVRYWCSTDAAAAQDASAAAARRERAAAEDAASRRQLRENAGLVRQLLGGGRRPLYVAICRAIPRDHVSYAGDGYPSPEQMLPVSGERQGRILLHRREAGGYRRIREL